MQTKTTILTTASGLRKSLRIPSLKNVTDSDMTSCWRFSSSEAGSNLLRSICALSRLFFGIVFSICSDTVFTSLILDARIYNFIKQIADQIGNNHQGSKKNSSSHDHCIISVSYGSHKLAADSSNCKNGFHNHRTGDNVCNFRACIGNNRDQRITKSMLENNFPFGNTFCFSCTDVILAERIKQKSAALMTGALTSWEDNALLDGAVPTTASTIPVGLFADCTNTAGTAFSTHYANARIYGVRFFTNGELVNDYIPYVKNGVAGFKDRKDGAFIVSATRIATSFGGNISFDSCPASTRP